VGITLALSSTLFLNGLAVQHQALLLRQMRFRAAAARQLAYNVVIFGVTVVAALLGASYWSLVIGQVAGMLVGVVTAWTAVIWWPSLPRRSADVRGLLSFGLGMSTFKIFDYLAVNADNVLIGRFLGADALGLYGRAYGLFAAPMQQVIIPVTGVARPMMSALWGDPARYKSYYLKVLNGMCYVVMPLVVVLAVLADNVVLVMLGSPWLKAAEVFRWLAIVGFLQVVGYTNGWLYATSGRAWAYARWATISRPIIVMAFACGLPWGIEGVAIAYACAQLILTPFEIAQAGRGTPVALRDVLTVVIRPTVLAGVAGIAALAVQLASTGSGLAPLMAGTSAATCAAGAVALAWPACRRELLGMAKVVAQRRGTE
jgi:O-antigen/teichoic acid export membrane protein